MKTLTVFTPAYNRKETLRRTYKSLCMQNCKDFVWLIIDDGSTDGTEEAVKEWMSENIIEIRYIYQENQGMHGAHNTAYHNIDTELNTCIDSDDYMTDDAVEKIITTWKRYGSNKYAGLMGLDVRQDGSLIGTLFKDNLAPLSLTDFYRTGGKGDRKQVYRTDVINSYPDYPVFKGEKYVGLDYKYSLIDRDFPLLTLNEPLVVVEYQPDGSSNSMYRQYWNNPQGWCFYRKHKMKMAQTFSKRFREAIHYVSSSIRAKDAAFVFKSPYPLTTLAAIPAGIILFLYTFYKVTRRRRMNIS